jgi:uncharacterized protein YuzE
VPNDTGAIDAGLRLELEKIAGALRQEDGQIQFGGPARKRIAVDAYAVLDDLTGEVLYSGYSMPMYFPRKQALPTISGILYRTGRKLYLVGADSNDRLLVVDTREIGDLFWILLCSALLGIVGFSGAYAAGMTFLRKYFLLTDSAPAGIAEARRVGEGLTVEFKKSISFEVQSSVDRVLESIAAFANAADGSIFIGIEDNGNVRGLRLEGGKARDALRERSIKQYATESDPIR